MDPRFRIRIPSARLGLIENDLEPMKLVAIASVPTSGYSAFEVAVPSHLMARFKAIVDKYKVHIDHVDYGEFQSSDDLSQLAEKPRLDSIGPVRAYKKTAVTRAVQCTSSRVIMMLNGPARAEPGDYICEDANGDLYVCSRDIFERTYERVN